MTKVTTYSFCEPFLDCFIEDLKRDYIQQGRDLSRIAIVFGGHRPALFVKRALAKEIGRAFYPPRFFSIDEFMGYVVKKHEAFEGTQDLDQCYLMYQLVKKHCPKLLDKRETFAQFLPWAREILSFVEQLDLECVEQDKLKGVERNAQIGYEVPEDINVILSEITLLRDFYHAHMSEARVYTRGFQYLRASELIDQTQFGEFDEILFANFFYFNRAEEGVVSDLYRQNKARLFFQGDQRRWPVFERIAKTLGTEIKEGKSVDVPKFDLKLYRGFDLHSQVCQLREILKNVKDFNKTVIVLPEPDHIIPLLSEIGPVIEDFNISLGYPLKRSSLMSLIEQVFRAQNSRDERGYYVHDYLKVLKHPLIKNLMLHQDAQVMRVLVHKIEEVLSGLEDSEISGSVFLELDDVLECKKIFELAHETLGLMSVNISGDELIFLLKEIHRYCFFSWEGINTFGGFAETLQAFLDILVHKSLLKNYPLNIRITEKIYDIVDELLAIDFSQEVFPCEDLFKIFLSKIDHEIVSFIGSPLKGLQILGLFETRSLNFDTVIVMDTNEGVLPRLSVHEALVPRDVMISLNLDRLEQEEEIQRYGFMRLISSAKTVHLIYQENRERERSRFVEELVWEQEKKKSRVDVVPVLQSGFFVQTRDEKHEAEKTPQMIEFLKNYRYSASSINTYLKNPIDFYYQYVLGLRPQEDLLDEPENRHVGTFIHHVLEKVFKPFEGRAPVMDKAFIQKFQNILNVEFEETFGRSKRADVFFLKRVIDERMKRFLEVEAQRCRDQVAEVMFVEKVFEDVVPLDSGDIRCVYKVDRVDRLKDGTILLLDYKTGASDDRPKMDAVASLKADREEIREVVKSFQLPLYFHYLKKTFPKEKIDAGFYNLRECQIKNFLSSKAGSDLEQIDEMFLRVLNYVVEEILDPNRNFVATE